VLLREKGSNLRCRWLTATRSTPFASLTNRVCLRQTSQLSYLAKSQSGGIRSSLKLSGLPTCNCLLELNTAWLTSSPERSRGLFLNRHAPCSYVIFPEPKTTKAALSFRERRLRNSGGSNYGECYIASSRPPPKPGSRACLCGSRGRQSTHANRPNRRSAGDSVFLKSVNASSSRLTSHVLRGYGRRVCIRTASKSVNPLIARSRREGAPFVAVGIRRDR